MKKRIAILITTLILTFVLINGIFAEEILSEHYEYAVKLNTLGLFKGTDIGFELEREPTRLEGAVMFVRLLGAEEEALEQNYAHPFIDVPQWGSPYVGYLYRNKLTKGISDSEFGSYMPLKAISYITFALRALGYSDSVPANDFTWGNSLEFLYENGIINHNTYQELLKNVFLRGHVVFLSLEFLKEGMKLSDISLAEKLVSDGIVDRGMAESMGIISEYDLNRIDISIGHSLEYVLIVLGNPDRGMTSRYGFYWMIYDTDMENYIQVGIENERVVAVLSASYGFGGDGNIRIGMTRNEVTAVYDEPLTELRKSEPDENIIYIYNLDNEDKGTFHTAEGDYITYYYDSYEDDIITALLIIDDKMEEKTLDEFIEPIDNSLYTSLETQVFGIANAIRIQKGLRVLVWETQAAKAAVLHSKDMADRDFFSHYNPEGDGLGDRFDNQGIKYISAGENIAFGYRDSVHMVNGWLNSQTGHRDILLGNFYYIGVGVWINDENRMFATQDYWR